MSQAGELNSAAGPLPPPVPTSFVTDVNSPAIPAANVLDVIGGTTSVNNAHGIQTDGSSGGHFLTVQLTNRYSQQTTTTGADNSTVTLLSALAAGTYVLDMSVAAYGTNTGSGAHTGNGYTIVGAIRSDGTTATLLPNQQKDSFEENVGANAVLNVSGNNAIVTLTGVANINFDWGVVGTYILVS